MDNPDTRLDLEANVRASLRKMRDSTDRAFHMCYQIAGSKTARDYTVEQLTKIGEWWKEAMLDLRALCLIDATDPRQVLDYLFHGADGIGETDNPNKQGDGKHGK